jgi:hypothetical protein
MLAETPAVKTDFSRMSLVHPDNCRESTLNMLLPIPSKSFIDHCVSQFLHSESKFKNITQSLRLITKSTKRLK